MLPIEGRQRASVEHSSPHQKTGWTVGVDKVSWVRIPLHKHIIYIYILLITYMIYIYIYINCLHLAGQPHPPFLKNYLTNFGRQVRRFNSRTGELQFKARKKWLPFILDLATKKLPQIEKPYHDIISEIRTPEINFKQFFKIARFCSSSSLQLQTSFCSC